MSKFRCNICNKRSQGSFVLLMYAEGYNQTALGEVRGRD